MNLKKLNMIYLFTISWGVIYKATISKENIIAYTNSRSEKEVILDYRKITDVSYEEVSRWFTHREEERSVYGRTYVFCKGKF